MYRAVAVVLATLCVAFGVLLVGLQLRSFHGGDAGPTLAEPPVVAAPAAPRAPGPRATGLESEPGSGVEAPGPEPARAGSLTSSDPPAVTRDRARPSPAPRSVASPPRPPERRDPWTARRQLLEQEAARVAEERGLVDRAALEMRVARLVPMGSVPPEHVAEATELARLHALSEATVAEQVAQDLSDPGPGDGYPDYRLRSRARALAHTLLPTLDPDPEIWLGRLDQAVSRVDD